MKNQARDKPSFSVIIPTFNRPETIERAIASVLGQTFDSYEVIVVDDGSESDYLTPWSENGDDTIRVIRQRRNLGAGPARNVGMKRACGRYISFLDDDDELMPSFLADTYRCLEASGADVGVSWSESIEVKRSDQMFGGLDSKSFPTHFEDRTRLFEQFMSIGTGFGFTIKRSCLRQVGDFNPSLQTVEDTDLFLRILSAGFLPVVAPGAGVVLHDHGGPRLTGPEWREANARECRWLLEEYAAFLEGYPSLASQLRLHMRSVLVGNDDKAFG